MMDPMHSLPHRAVAISACLAALAIMLSTHGPATVSAQAPAASVCDIRTAERVVAVGDVHGAYDSFVAILKAAGIVDARERWAGGRAVLIQTGDVLDRGADSRKVMDLLRRLERDAARAGGRAIPLLGNHEFMRLIGDWRYVSAGELQAFRRADSEDLREAMYQRALEATKARAAAAQQALDEADYRKRFLAEIPLGFIEMRRAFDVKGDYGPWIRSRPVMAMVNGIAFLHGGVSQAVAPLGCEGVNAAVAKEMASLPVEPAAVPTLLATREDGPLWYRGLAQESEAAFEPGLTAILERLGARAIVVGHTPVLPGRIAPRFGGRVIQIDTGMLDGEFYPKGVPVALELRGNAATAIYLDRREPLALPALAPPAAAPASR
jgi:hypothetical protein